MKSFISKMWSDYGILGVIFVCVALYGVMMTGQYLMKKGTFGIEPNAGMPDQYKAQSGPVGASPSGTLGQNAIFAAADGLQSSGLNEGCANPGQMQNVDDLLPQDTNNEWAQNNPVGTGDFEGVGLLKAGHHIGINTIGQSLRNANLQLRADIPNPQLDVGPWNQSTIEPQEFMRAPLEFGM
jgi:hypothetical protein